MDDEEQLIGASGSSEDSSGSDSCGEGHYGDKLDAWDGEESTSSLATTSGDDEEIDEQIFGDEEEHKVGESTSTASHPYTSGPVDLYWQEQPVREDEQFCEMPRTSTVSRTSVAMSRCAEEAAEETRQRRRGVLYPPQRSPPLVDFFVLLTAFLAAVVAAYYSI